MDTSHYFIAIYEGKTVSQARIVAATADASIVASVVDKLLGQSLLTPGEDTPVDSSDGSSSMIDTDE